MNSKNKFLVYLMTFFMIIPAIGQSDSKFKVVIDAGHGGHDPGCIGTQLQEKNVALDVALKVGKLISEHCPDVQVIYTRKTDVFVELYRRAQIANDAHANLFISIHCNSAENSQGNGVETFVMGLAKSEANQAVARKENAAILKEKNYQNNYDGFNPDSPESNVLFSLYSTAYLNNSITLASKVQRNLVNNSHLTDRGVKQAGYWVLYKVAMPSILIELGFLSNAKDQSYLSQQTNLQREAEAIYNAFVEYLTIVNGSTHDQIKIDNQVSTPETTKKEEQSVVESKSGQGAQTVCPEQQSAAGESQTQEKTLAEQANEVVTDNSNQSDSTSEIHFRIQFLTSSSKIAANDKRLQGLPNVACYQENGLWKYTAGNETDYNTALAVQESVKQSYSDAFMIAFQGDKKISVKEARQLLKK